MKQTYPLILLPYSITQAPLCFILLFFPEHDMVNMVNQSEIRREEMAIREMFLKLSIKREVGAHRHGKIKDNLICQASVMFNKADAH